MTINNSNLSKITKLSEFNKDISLIENIQDQHFLSCTRNKEIQMFKNKGKSVQTFDREVKLPQPINEIPAPNQYNISYENYDKKQKIAFPKSRSNAIYKKDIVPGPGSYNLASVLYKKVKNYTYNKNNKSIADIQQQQQLLNEMNKKEQDKIDNNQSKNQNNLSQNSLGRKLLTTFGSAPKFEKLNKIIAGPGDYDITYDCKKKPIKTTIKQKYNQFINLEQNILQPGPGSYNLRLPVIYNKQSIGKSVRISEKINQNPGPGEYQSKSIFDKQYEFKIIDKLLKDQSQQ